MPANSCMPACSAIHIICAALVDLRNTAAHHCGLLVDATCACRRGIKVCADKPRFQILRAALDSWRTVERQLAKAAHHCQQADAATDSQQGVSAPVQLLHIEQAVAALSQAAARGIVNGTRSGQLRRDAAAGTAGTKPQQQKGPDSSAADGNAERQHACNAASAQTHAKAGSKASRRNTGAWLMPPCMSF